MFLVVGRRSSFRTDLWIFRIGQISSLKRRRRVHGQASGVRNNPLNRDLRELRRRVIRTARVVPAATLLRTVPGIGPYWGLVLAAELLPIERFPGTQATGELHGAGAKPA